MKTHDELLAITNKPRMRISLDGITSRIMRGRGAISKADKFMLGEVARLYGEGKKAWLVGDYETVAELFGIID